MIELAGDARKDDIGKILISTLPKYRESTYRESISLRMQQMVDGKGAKRIVKHLINDKRLTAQE